MAAPKPLKPVVKPEGTGEHPVAEADLGDVPGGRAAGDRDAGHAFGPGRKVALGIADHRRLAGRAGGGVDPDKLLLRYGKKTEGIIVTQVGLRHEGEPCKVGERLDIRGGNAALLHLFAVGGDLVPHPRYRLPEARELEGLHFGAGESFFFCPDHSSIPLFDFVFKR